jgi:hypothetical protein
MVFFASFQQIDVHMQAFVNQREEIPEAVKEMQRAE